MCINTHTPDVFVEYSPLPHHPYQREICSIRAKYRTFPQCNERNQDHASFLDNARIIPSHLPASVSQCASSTPFCCPNPMAEETTHAFKMVNTTVYELWCILSKMDEFRSLMVLEYWMGLYGKRMLIWWMKTPRREVRWSSILGSMELRMSRDFCLWGWRSVLRFDYCCGDLGRSVGAVDVTFKKQNRADCLLAISFETSKLCCVTFQCMRIS